LARTSANYLTSKQWRVQWYQNVNNKNEEEEEEEEEKQQEAPSNNNSGGKGLGGFMSSVSNVMNNVVSSTKKLVGVNTTLHAKLKLKDTVNGPALHVIATLPDRENDDDHDTEDEEEDEVKSLKDRMKRKRPTKTILLSEIGSVEPTHGRTGFKVYGHKSVVTEEAHGDKLLKCDLLGFGGMDDSTIGKLRDEFLQHLRFVLEWDKRHSGNDASSATGANNNNNEDAISAGPVRATGLRGKAQKAAHFAKRELELQTMKREREKRKSKYLEASGGLKYTALAMAQRAG